MENKKDVQLPISVGSQIKAARKDQKLTQAELAEKVGVDRVQIGQWESKKRNPRTKNFNKIAEALNMSPEELMNYKTPGRKKYDEMVDEMNANPLTFRIETINILLQGLSEKGLDAVLKSTVDIINMGGDYLRPPQL